MFIIGARDFSPIDVVGTFLALDFAHESAANTSAGILRGTQFGGFEVNRVPLGIRFGHSKAETASWIDLMEFQVLGFKPGILP